MRILTARGYVALLGAALLAVAVTATTSAAPAQKQAKPAHVSTKSDAAKAKLAPELQQQLASGSTAPVGVFVTLHNGNTAQVRTLLDNDYVASSDGLSLVIGKIGAQQLAKLAGVSGVSAVQPIQFKQTGQPLGVDPEVGNQPDKKTRNEALREFQKNSVPYDKAPPLKTSNFDAAEAARTCSTRRRTTSPAPGTPGFTGTGVTGGRARRRHRLRPSRPARHVADLAADRQPPTDPGWVGWPKAFDPYDTLVDAPGART